MTQREEKLLVFVLAALQFIHMVDFVMMMPLGPTLMEELDLQTHEFSYLVSSYQVAAALFGFVLGIYADRFNRRFLLIASFLGLLIGTFFCSQATGFTSFLVARMVTGCFGGFTGVLIMALVTDFIPYERRGKAVASIMMAFSIASVLGVPGSLTIADFLGWRWSFMSVSIIGLIFLGLCFKTIPPTTPKKDGGNFREQWLVYFELFREKDYRLAFTFMILVAMSMFIVIPFLSPYAVGNMGIATTELKYMYLVGGLATILTARLIGVLTDRIGAKKLFLIVGGLSVIPVLLYGQADQTPFWLYLIYGSAFMTMVSGRMIPCMTMLTRIPSELVRGRYMAILNSIRSLGAALATIVGGLLTVKLESGAIVGFDHATYLSVGMIIISLIFSLRIARLSAQKS